LKLVSCAFAEMFLPVLHTSCSSVRHYYHLFIHAAIHLSHLSPGILLDIGAIYPSVCVSRSQNWALSLPPRLTNPSFRLCCCWWRRWEMQVSYLASKAS